MVDFARPRIDTESSSADINKWTNSDFKSAAPSQSRLEFVDRVETYHSSTENLHTKKKPKFWTSILGIAVICLALVGILIGEIIAIVGTVVVLAWKLFSRTRPQIAPAKQWGQASSDRFRYEELFEGAS